MKPILSGGVLLLFAIVCMPESVKICDISVKGLLGVSFCIYFCFILVAFFIILYKDPKLLQSEHFQLSMRQMDLAAQRLGAQPTLQIGIDTSQMESANVNSEELTSTEAVASNDDALIGVVP